MSPERFVKGESERTFRKLNEPIPHGAASLDCNYY
jgi:hypothetical protein